MMEAASTWQHEQALRQPIPQITPPVAIRRPAVLARHGDKRVDPYYWLRQRANPEVIAYLEAENDYTDAVMAPGKELEDRIYGEIVGRIKQTDMSPPTFHRGWWQYTRTVEGLNYDIYCRRHGSMRVITISSWSTRRHGLRSSAMPRPRSSAWSTISCRSRISSSATSRLACSCRA